MIIFRFKSLAVGLTFAFLGACQNSPFSSLGDGPIADLIGGNLGADDLDLKLERYVQREQLTDKELRRNLIRAGFKEYDKSNNCESMSLHVENDAVVEGGSTQIVAKWCGEDRVVGFDVKNYGVMQP